LICALSGEKLNLSLLFLGGDPEMKSVICFQGISLEFFGAKDRLRPERASGSLRQSR
jgi:hypothetical protein